MRQNVRLKIMHSVYSNQRWFYIAPYLFSVFPEKYFLIFLSQALTSFAFCDSKWIECENIFKSCASLFGESQLKCFCALFHSSLVRYPILFAPARHAKTKTSNESGASSGYFSLTKIVKKILNLFKIT